MSRSRSFRYRLRRLIDCVELSVELGDRDDELTLRIEIFECAEPPRYYCARVWRLEMYRLQSTFPQRPPGTPRHWYCVRTVASTRWVYTGRPPV